MNMDFSQLGKIRQIMSDPNMGLDPVMAQKLRENNVNQKYYVGDAVSQGLQGQGLDPRLAAVAGFMSEMAMPGPGGEANMAAKAAPAVDKMTLKAVMENPLRLNINRLVKDAEYFQAEKDVANGMGSFTKLPILVEKAGDGVNYAIRDGRHRLAEAIARGETAVPIMTDEGLYRKLSSLEEALRNSRFTKDAFGKFTGSISRAAK